MGIYLILSQSVFAQSVLNFAKVTISDRVNAGFAVTNPTSNYVDVTFTLYGLDGNPVSSGLVNPVRHRVSPKGQLSLFATQLFAASRVDGWVQVTSPASGLTGVYFLGDFTSSLEGADSAQPLTTQIVPVIREDQTSTTELIVLNPGVGSTAVTVTFFNSRGVDIGTTQQSIAGHGAVRLRPALLIPNLAATAASAKITSAVPVSAIAAISRGDALLFAPGQAIDQPSPARIVPHYTNRNGFDPHLILVNPTASPVKVTVTLFGENGGAVDPSLDGPSAKDFTIQPNEQISADIATITGRVFFGLSTEGWVRIDSPNVPLSGLLVLDKGQAMTALPIQSSAMDRVVYSQISETDMLYTGLALVNPAATPATLEISLIHADGTTFAQKSIGINPNSKVSALLRDLLPAAVGETSGYIFLRSSAPIFGVGLFGATNSSFLAMMPPGRIPDAYLPDSILKRPVISRIESGTDVLPGSSLRVTLADFYSDVEFVIGGQSVPSRSALVPGSPAYVVSVPASVEPGFINLRVRGNGLESIPVSLRVLTSDNQPAQIVAGEAFYQKIDVKDTGLDLDHPVMVPIRSARVEVLNGTQTVVAVSETDQRGQFTIPIPFDPTVTIRIISRLRSSDLKVADNTRVGSLYSITTDIDGREPRLGIVLTDASRVSGAFNILEMVQRANDTIRSADSKIVPPAVTIYWSTKNTTRSGDKAQGLIGTSYFNISDNTAYVLGDRNEDSDEFDDSVLVHEYAHMLAAKFSRDDSPGGPHGVGDMLDPRISWSEGWANFFSSAVRNDPVWRDSRGPNGANVLRYDLEDNVPPGDKPGYWSEASIDTLLWDLYDDHVDAGDNVQYPFSWIWNAFTDLRNDRFVYLPYFLDHFLARYPAATDAVRTMALIRSIDFQPGVKPSVTLPFPRPMTTDTVTGEVDSLTPRRSNLMTSSHFWSFATTGGDTSIRMDITGFGPADNPNANDLDIYLMDVNGRVLFRSDRGLNGQSELISARLAAGTYVVEVRSYYRADTGSLVFNSGRYRLNVAIAGSVAIAP